MSPVTSGDIERLDKADLAIAQALDRLEGRVKKLEGTQKERDGKTEGGQS